MMDNMETERPLGLLLTTAETTLIHGAAMPLVTLRQMLERDGFRVDGAVLPESLRPQAWRDVDDSQATLYGMPITWGTAPGLIVSPY